MRSIVVAAYPLVMNNSRALSSIRRRVCRARSALVGLLLTGFTSRTLLDEPLVSALVNCFLTKEGEAMPVIRNSVILRCSPEDAFDYLSDPRAELEWNPKCETMEKLTEGPVGLGTRYRAKWKSSPYVELEILAFERPHSWTMHNGGPIEVRLTCQLESAPQGTRLQATFEPTPHGWFRLIFPIFLTVIRREEKANMTQLRDSVERWAETRR